ncbi:hypothetical protein H9Q69_013352 [Fusarium xylarioides]|uniref:F-box domain-containing protein n=1 Tax=Fusarium xylarioides TaxID=221167 RepID=A0A9P7KW09_9HYPO|nr:hypothetical protein H9Q70_008033 [Fusarium xylarioides]KAG5759351.1 hypothetical protein H9Q72_012521 [Fusarium xylarioides]KAG5775271.1 hypothetical protein H9Q73_011054 [Fusarium xylarioides]KAG5787582.1 hypothetical protein H9Q69_013352 [Fusarium xylarioides]
MPPRFHSLPPEIQAMILQEVSREPSTAVYAAVCKAWQHFFEQKNFKSLAIDQHELTTFCQTVTPRRQRFVKHIWYRILLPRHDSLHFNPGSKTSEDPSVLWGVDNRFTECIFRLWDIISLWNRENRITLELSTFSYQDWDYVTEDNRVFERDLEAYKAHKKSESREPYRYDNPQGPYVEQYGFWGLPNAHLGIQDYWEALTYDLLGWKEIEFVTAAEDDHAVEYFKEEDAILPSVPIVSKFLIRNTQFRQFWPQTLLHMFESFDNIEDITIERWASGTLEAESQWIEYAAKPFAEWLPVTVKKFSVNGEKCAVLHDWETCELVNREALAKHLRQNSKRLEHMSVVDIIDASHFLDIFRTYVTDEDLETFIQDAKAKSDREIALLCSESSTKDAKTSKTRNPE